jgi:hypothetical protein
MRCETRRIAGIASRRRQKVRPDRPMSELRIVELERKSRLDCARNIPGRPVALARKPAWRDRWNMRRLDVGRRKRDCNDRSRSKQCENGQAELSGGGAGRPGLDTGRARAADRISRIGIGRAAAVHEHCLGDGRRVEAEPRQRNTATVERSGKIQSQVRSDQKLIDAKTGAPESIRGSQLQLSDAA